MNDFIPYGKQDVDDDDVAAVEEVLRSDWLTTGPNIDRFEKDFASYVGAKECVAVNSGTAALELAVACLDLPAGSEIITTPLTFVADANCALFNGCIPVLADIRKDTFTLDPDDVRKRITSKTKAIIYVDYGGLPADVDEFQKIADAHGLYLIEDSCPALGATYNGEKVGSLVDMTVFSFHPVKHITTAGEGGAITTNNPKWAARMRRLRTHGMDTSSRERFGKDASYAYDVTALSRNFRISDAACAMGSSQLKRLDGFLNRLREIAKMYNKAFTDTDLTLQKVPEGREHAYHLYTVLLPIDVDRDEFYKKMRAQGIGVNVHYIPIYKFTLYKGRFDPKDYPITEEVFSRIITLPLHKKLTDDDVKRVISTTLKTLTDMRGRG